MLGSGTLDSVEMASLYIEAGQKQLKKSNLGFNNRSNAITVAAPNLPPLDLGYCPRNFIIHGD
jgi:hypothetical protein